MQHTALITRMITVADESIQIIIQDIDNFNVFKAAIEEALKITDKRAAVQQRRLLEDTSLTDAMSEHEVKSTIEAADIIYPMQYTIDMEKLQGAKFEFAKNMASGEVLKVFLHNVDAYEDLYS